MDVVFFSSPTDFRRWLTANHKKIVELWVGFYKKSSGQPSITYPEAVDQALCYGWIDGVRKSIDEGAYTIRFTPRKPKSQWSTINIKRAKALVADGRMHPAGMKAFEDAEKQPRKYSYEQRHHAVFDKESDRRFRDNRKAWDFFQAQPPWYRRISTFWVVSAKQEETRKRRLATLIADSECGQLVKPLRRPAVPKRMKK